MDQVDWSAMGDEFKLAESVLSERWDEAYALMRQIGPTGRLNKSNYRDWPLFRELRKQEQFGAVFEEVFGQPFAGDISVERKELSKPQNSPEQATVPASDDNGGTKPKDSKTLH